MPGGRVSWLNKRINKKCPDGELSDGANTSGDYRFLKIVTDLEDKNAQVAELS